MGYMMCFAKQRYREQKYEEKREMNWQLALTSTYY